MDAPCLQMLPETRIFLQTSRNSGERTAYPHSKNPRLPRKTVRKHRQLQYSLLLLFFQSMNFTLSNKKSGNFCPLKSDKFILSFFSSFVKHLFYNPITNFFSITYNYKSLTIILINKFFYFFITLIINF